MSAGRPRILLVDDDAVDRRIARRAFRGTPLDAEAEFAEAETGEQALALIRQEGWSCVLLDHRLPDVDGMEVLMRLAGPGGEVEVPVVIVTGMEDVTLAVEAMRRGARDYLVKDAEGHYQALMPAVVQRVIHEEALRQGKQKAEAELRRAELRYRSLIEQLPAITYVMSLDEPGALLFVSPQIRELGLDPDRLCADPESFWQHVHPDDREEARQRWEAMRRDKTECDCEYRVITPDGRQIWLRNQARAISDGSDRGPFVQGILTDVTAAKSAEAELRAHRHHLAELVAQRTEALQDANRRLQEDIVERERVERALFQEKQRVEVTLQSIGDAVITADAQGRVTYLNPAAEGLTGWALAEVRGRHLGECLAVQCEDGRPAEEMLDMLAGTSPPCLHLRLQARSGKEIIAAVKPAALQDPDGRPVGMVLVLRDVTEERRLAEQLAHQARHDALTGLVNRAEFERRVRHALEGAAENPSEHVLCVLDLDGFKLVNDSGGHAAGDELLRQLARRMSGEIRARDTLARLGGDEFGCLFEHCRLEQGTALATDLLEAIRSYTLLWQGRSYSVTASLGVVAIDRGTESLEKLFQAADAAAYAAKAAGRNRVKVSRGGRPEPAGAAQEEWGNRILAAMREGELLLFQQPIFDLQQQEAPVACEVLLRLAQGEQRISAAHFMPAVARYRISGQLDRWVVRETLDHLARERGAAGGPVYLINISEASLADPDLVAYIAEQLHVHGVSADRIGFEVGEHALLGRFEDARVFLRGVKALGCRIALDDFADALPHLSSLRELRPDYLKIRGDLVQSLGRDAVLGSLVESISRVGHAAGIHSIAQWPQDEESLETLQHYGVDHVQGNFVQVPYPLAAMR